MGLVEEKEQKYKASLKDQRSTLQRRRKKKKEEDVGKKKGVDQRVLIYCDKWRTMEYGE